MMVGITASRLLEILPEIVKMDFFSLQMDTAHLALAMRI